MKPKRDAIPIQALSHLTTWPANQPFGGAKDLDPRGAARGRVFHRQYAERRCNPLFHRSPYLSQGPQNTVGGIKGPVCPALCGTKYFMKPTWQTARLRERKAAKDTAAALATSYRQRLDAEHAAQAIRWVPNKALDFRVIFGYVLRRRKYTEPPIAPHPLETDRC